MDNKIYSNNVSANTRQITQRRMLKLQLRIKFKTIYKETLFAKCLMILKNIEKPNNIQTTINNLPAENKLSLTNWGKEADKITTLLICNYAQAVAKKTNNRGYTKDIRNLQKDVNYKTIGSKEEKSI